MLNYISVILAVVLAAALSLTVYFLKRRGVNISLVAKIAALLLFVCAFFAYMLEREAIFGVVGLNMYSPFGDDIPRTVFALLLIWFTFAAMLTTVFDSFYAFPSLRFITRFFSLPVFLLDLVFFETYSIAVIGVGSGEVFDIRLPFIVLELALGIALIVSSAIGERITFPRGTALRDAIVALVGAIIVIMPSNIPQALFGYIDVNIRTEDFSEAHRVVLYFAVIIPVIMFHLLKNKSFEVRRFALIYYSVAHLWAYISHWILSDWASPLRWPLHLCNTAMFLIPLCLLFNLKKIYYFSLFINVLGATLASFMPDISSWHNTLSTDVIHYWLNHYDAFFMPILMMALGLFRRPRFREWVYSLVAFTVYFVFILFMNVWLSNYGKVDFFFLNSDFISDKLGRWAEEIRGIEASFNVGDLVFSFRPLYQFLFYLVYVAISVGVWFLFEILFSSWDRAAERRLKEADYKRMKRELKEFLGGKSIHETISGDDSPRIILKDFKKRYGSNKHYSVDGVSLDVRGGEIFGFLGPNGAGKSTIIKSIVGIQTITEGSIEICGFNVERQPVQAKLNLGFVPDHYALYENLTGREYINYIADLYQISREYRDKTIEKYVTLFQLTGSFDNQMKTYSHGMKQKIAIMAALVHNPKVWILDEPLTGLDPTSIHEVKECMKDHAARGNIVFFSSHIIDVVEKICDRIAIIKKGKLRAEARVADIEASGNTLERFYLDVIGEDDEAAAADGTEPIEINGSMPDVSGAMGV